MLRKKKIGKLALQETHLTGEVADQIESLFTKHIRLLNSSCEINPTASASVAFVINKDLSAHPGQSTFPIHILAMGQPDTPTKYICTLQFK